MDQTETREKPALHEVAQSKKERKDMKTTTNGSSSEESRFNLWWKARGRTRAILFLLGFSLYTAAILYLAYCVDEPFRILRGYVLLNAVTFMVAWAAFVFSGSSTTADSKSKEVAK